MQTKICTKCKVEKNLNEFNSNKDRPCGKRSECKTCQSDFLKKNSSRINEKRKQKLLELKKDKDGYKKFLENKRKINKESYNNKNKLSKDDLLNRELIRAKNKLDDIFKSLYKSSKLSPESKKEILLKRERDKHHEKQNNDIQYRLISNLRSLIRRSHRKQWAGKNSNSTELLGMSGKEFYEYFLSLNYNPDYDQIDHIVPISRFDLTIKDHQLVACHYLNLQPLHQKLNYIKWNALIEGWQEKIYQICEMRNINPEPIIKHIEAGI